MDLLGQEPLRPVVKAGRKVEDLKLDQALGSTTRLCCTLTSPGEVLEMLMIKDRLGRHV